MQSVSSQKYIHNMVACEYCEFEKQKENPSWRKWNTQNGIFPVTCWGHLNIFSASIKDTRAVRERYLNKLFIWSALHSFLRFSSFVPQNIYLHYIILPWSNQVYKKLIVKFILYVLKTNYDFLHPTLSLSYFWPFSFVLSSVDIGYSIISYIF